MRTLRNSFAPWALILAACCAAAALALFAAPVARAQDPTATPTPTPTPAPTPTPYLTPTPVAVTNPPDCGDELGTGNDNARIEYGTGVMSVYFGEVHQSGAVSVGTVHCTIVRGPAVNNNQYSVLSTVIAIPDDGADWVTWQFKELSISSDMEWIGGEEAGLWQCSGYSTILFASRMSLSDSGTLTDDNDLCLYLGELDLEGTAVTHKFPLQNSEEYPHIRFTVISLIGNSQSQFDAPCHLVNGTYPKNGTCRIKAYVGFWGADDDYLVNGEFEFNLPEAPLYCQYDENGKCQLQGLPNNFVAQLRDRSFNDDGTMSWARVAGQWDDLAWADGYEVQRTFISASLDADGEVQRNPQGIVITERGDPMVLDKAGGVTFADEFEPAGALRVEYRVRGYRTSDPVPGGDRWRTEWSDSETVELTRDYDYRPVGTDSEGNEVELIDDPSRDLLGLVELITTIGEPLGYEEVGRKVIGPLLFVIAAVAAGLVMLLFRMATTGLMLGSMVFVLIWLGTGPMWFGIPWGWAVLPTVVALLGGAVILKQRMGV